ncbi:MAG: hypothetical protein WC491_07015 [Candidatus Omnitrophota bacterium]
MQAKSAAFDAPLRCFDSDALFTANFDETNLTVPPLALTSNTAKTAFGSISEYPSSIMPAMKDSIFLSALVLYFANLRRDRTSSGGIFIGMFFRKTISGLLEPGLIQYLRDELVPP